MRSLVVRPVCQSMNLAVWLLGAAIRVLGSANDPCVTYYCTFDSTTGPAVHVGDFRVLVTGPTEYSEGVSGRALVCGDGKAELKIPRPGNYSLAESTVSFWVRPLDWTGTDGQFHIFFQASANLPNGRGRGARLLYKYLVPGQFLQLAIPDEEVPYVNYYGAAYADISSWKPGEWHHVVGTWRGDGFALYLDGKVIGGQTYYPMPMSMGEFIEFGDRTWQPGRNAHSLLDELMIFDRELNPSEVELLHRRFAPGVRKEPGLNVALRPLFLSRRIEAVVDTARVQTFGDSARVSVGDVLRVELAARGAEKPIAAAQWQVARSRAEFTTIPLSLRGVAAGEYEVAVALQGPTGKRIAGGQASVTVPQDPPWLGSRVGISQTPPSPWTPMSEKAGDVVCWNRDYRVLPGPLCQQITTAGQAILSRPVDLIVRNNGKLVGWQNRKLTITERQPTQVGFQSSASSKAVRLSVRGRIEYDGMAWFEATLSPTRPGLTLDGVCLDIPLQSSVVRFYAEVSAQRVVEKLAGEVPGNDGTVLSRPFLPVLWLGNDDRGLQWFTESSEPWDDPKREGSVRLERRGDVATLKVEPVAQASSLPFAKPYCFAFGLQASPIRPVCRDWRKYRLSGIPGTVHMIWANKEDMIWFGYPRARHPEDLRKRIAEFHQRKVRVIPYSTPFLLSLDCPESKLYGSEWVRPGEGDSGSGDVVAMGGCAQYAIPGAPHYADFTTWAHQQFVREIGFDGLYFDGSGLGAMDLPTAGCGYLRDGMRVPTYPILAKRGILKRMYTMLKEMNPDHFLMIHCSGQAVLPCMGFGDVRAMGEDLGMRLQKTPDYRKILTEAEWRAIECGHPYGFSNILLPEFPAKAREDPVPTEQVMGRILLYGMDVWPGYCNEQAQGAMRAATFRFPMIGAEFLPFWANPPAKVSRLDVRVSVYRQPGAALLVIVNEADETVKVRILPEYAGLGVAADASWRDLLADKAMTPGEDIETREGNYRLVQIGEAKEAALTQRP